MSFFSRFKFKKIPTTNVNAAFWTRPENTPTGYESLADYLVKSDTNINDAFENDATVNTALTTDASVETVLGRTITKTEDVVEIVESGTVIEDVTGTQFEKNDKGAWDKIDSGALDSFASTGKAIAMAMVFG